PPRREEVSLRAREVSRAAKAFRSIAEDAEGRRGGRGEEDLVLRIVSSLGLEAPEDEILFPPRSPRILRVLRDTSESLATREGSQPAKALPGTTRSQDRKST